MEPRIPITSLPSANTTRPSPPLTCRIATSKSKASITIKRNDRRPQRHLVRLSYRVAETQPGYAALFPALMHVFRDENPCLLWEACPIGRWPAKRQESLRGNPTIAEENAEASTAKRTKVLRFSAAGFLPTMASLNLRDCAFIEYNSKDAPVPSQPLRNGMCHAHRRSVVESSPLS